MHLVFLRVYLGITIYTICHLIFIFMLCTLYMSYFKDHFRDMEFVTLIHQIRHNESATGASDNGNGMN